MKIKGWEKFQHFKDRKPPWIKLYRELLDDIEWHILDPSAAKCLIMIWLVASENFGELPPLKQLAFRLRIKESELNQLCTKLSHWLIQDDITMISRRYQDDTPETETETETDRNTTSKPVSKFTPPSASDVQTYMAEIGFVSGSGEKFVDYYTSRGWMIGNARMKDWKAAVRNWKRRNSDNEQQSLADTPGIF